MRMQIRRFAVEPLVDLDGFDEAGRYAVHVLDGLLEFVDRDVVVPESDRSERTSVRHGWAPPQSQPPSVQLQIGPFWLFP